MYVTYLILVTYLVAPSSPYGVTSYCFRSAAPYHCCTLRALLFFCIPRFPVTCCVIFFKLQDGASQWSPCLLEVAVGLQASLQCSLNAVKAISWYARGRVGRIYLEPRIVRYTNSVVVRLRCFPFITFFVSGSVVVPAATQISVPPSHFGYFNPSKERSY